MLAFKTVAEVIHGRPNMMTKARNTQGEREEGIEDIYDSMESLRDQHQDYVGTEESSNTLGTVRSQQPDPVSPPRRYHQTVGILEKSRKLCVTDGADLVVVDSKEEMDFISRYGGHTWLGATDEASDGLWRWLDGTVLSVDNPSWERGNPDGGKENNCLGRVWEQLNIKWTDESCEAFNYGLCE
ncbi:unnamed protein product [Arctogadus glacialis]